MDMNINIGNIMKEYRNVRSPPSITDDIMTPTHKIPLEIHRVLQFLLIYIYLSNPII